MFASEAGAYLSVEDLNVVFAPRKNTPAYYEHLKITAIKVL
jgi:hypothetical protein